MTFPFDAAGICPTDATGIAPPDAAGCADAFDAAVRDLAPALGCRAEHAGDGSFLAALFIACSPLTGLLPPTMVAQQAAMQDEAYAGAYPQAMRRIITRGGRLVGRIAIDWPESRENSATRCIDIAVLPAHQGAGIGRALLAAWLAVADGAGRDAALQVRADNPAMHLYARLSFIADAGDRGLPIVGMTRRAGDQGLG